VIAGYLDPSPPIVPADFGFHHEWWLVKLCRICANNWHWTPDETLAQPLALVFDMIRDHNLQDAVETARDKGHCESVEDVLDYLRAYRDEDPFEIIEYDDLPLMRFSRGD